MDIQEMLVVMPTRQKHREALQNAAPGARLTRRKPEELTKEDVETADVIIGNLPPAFLPYMQKARLLQLNTAGVAAPYLALKDREDAPILCCASGAYGPAVSEHMLAMLMCLMKRLHQYRDDQHLALWQDRGSVSSLASKQVLMVGLGDIGLHFARLCHLLGATVTGIRRRAQTPPYGVKAVHPLSALDSLLPEADVVALALPDTKETARVMNAHRIVLMKEGSYLINVGRGSALDQEALLHALQSGQLAGAALDVTEPEPLPKEHPLWQQQNLLLTPHISGYYHLPLTHDLVVDIACRNIKALPDGPFIAQVDYKTGYAK